jgi:hypothetical protein
MTKIALSSFKKLFAFFSPTDNRPRPDIKAAHDQPDLDRFVAFFWIGSVGAPWWRKTFQAYFGHMTCPEKGVSDEG